MAAKHRRQSAASVARALKVDPFKYLCDRFNKCTDHKEKVPLALELLPYCYPKLKAVEHSAAEDQSVTITVGGKPLPNEVAPETLPNEVTAEPRPH